MECGDYVTALARMLPPCLAPHTRKEKRRHSRRTPHGRARPRRPMPAFWADPRVPEKVGAKDVGNTGDLERIEAKGHVTITQGERVVTGEDAIFYQDTQQIVMTGNAVMREGRNVIRGDRIVVFLNEDRGIVESIEKSRVKAVIYPEEKKDKKK